jgi:hypothetical protein
VSSRQRERVPDYIDIGKSEGRSVAPRPATYQTLKSIYKVGPAN